MKRCSTCKQTTNYTFFDRNKSTNDGYHTICKNCRTISRIKKRFKDLINNINIKRDYNYNLTLLEELYSDKNRGMNTLSIIFDCSEDVIVNALKVLKIYNKRKCKGICNSWKELNDFSNCKKDKSHGKQFYCKPCYMEYKRERAKDPISKEKDRITHRLNYIKNNDRINERKARRRAIECQAVVSWGNQEKIREIYRESKRLEQLDGIKRHVDHIIPIQGKNVCGLHIETNLQILTELENKRKGNSFNDLAESA